MAETQNNVAMLHRKEWQTMSPAPSATIAGSLVVASPDNNVALYFNTNTLNYLYHHDEDDWVQIPSGPFAVAAAAGSCGTYSHWSRTMTAVGGTTSTITVAAASFNLNGFVRNKTIEFLSGTATNIGLRRTITNIITNAGIGNITLVLDSPVTGAVANNDTFRIASGSFFILNAGTLAATNYFKRLDVATLSWTDLAITGLPATIGTDCKLVHPYVLGDSYDSGTATSGSTTTLVQSTRNWTSGQWVNYQVRITAGTGMGQVRVITANTATQLTFATGAAIDATSQFVIEGDENAIYVLGNNAVTLYKYSISGNTSSTVSVTAARAGAPAGGMSATFISKVPDASWSDINSIKDGRYIYSLRGGASTIIDRYDIASLTWLATNYVGVVTYTAGTSVFNYGKYLYIAKEGTANIPQRIYKYSLTGNYLEPVTSDYYYGAAAVIGNKMWIKPLSSAGVIKWLYLLQSGTGNLRRIMLF